MKPCETIWFAPPSGKFRKHRFEVDGSEHFYLDDRDTEKAIIEASRELRKESHNRCPYRIFFVDGNVDDSTSHLIGVTSDLNQANEIVNVWNSHWPIIRIWDVKHKRYA
jgi:hypothetical protein